nr:unnamed protein product [Callosobruchus chinensis]
MKHFIYNLRTLAKMMYVYHANFAALWHEGIFGRSKDDETPSTLRCGWTTARHKTKTGLLFLLYMINLEEIVASEIIIKYFEPGQFLWLLTHFTTELSYL